MDSRTERLYQAVKTVKEAAGLPPPSPDARALRLASALKEAEAAVQPDARRLRLVTAMQKVAHGAGLQKEAYAPLLWLAGAAGLAAPWLWNMYKRKKLGDLPLQKPWEEQQMAWTQDQFEQRQRDALSRFDRRQKEYVNLADGRIMDAQTGEVMTAEQRNARLGAYRQQETTAAHEWLRNQVDTAAKNSRWDYQKGRRVGGNLPMPDEVANSPLQRDFKDWQQKYQNSNLLFMHRGIPQFGRSEWLDAARGVKREQSDTNDMHQYRSGQKGLFGGDLWQETV
jgi:multidrug efflux pump subunit AcrA (membrane-fusion protein)